MKKLSTGLYPFLSDRSYLSLFVFASRGEIIVSIDISQHVLLTRAVRPVSELHTYAQIRLSSPQSYQHIINVNSIAWVHRTPVGYGFQNAAHSMIIMYYTLSSSMFSGIYHGIPHLSTRYSIHRLLVCLWEKFEISCDFRISHVETENVL